MLNEFRCCFIKTYNYITWIQVVACLLKRIHCVLACIMIFIRFTSIWDVNGFCVRRHDGVVGWFSVVELSGDCAMPGEACGRLISYHLKMFYIFTKLFRELFDLLSSDSRCLDNHGRRTGQARPTVPRSQPDLWLRNRLVNKMARYHCWVHQVSSRSR